MPAASKSDDLCDRGLLCGAWRRAAHAHDIAGNWDGATMFFLSFAVAAAAGLIGIARSFAVCLSPEMKAFGHAYGRLSDRRVARHRHPVPAGRGAGPDRHRGPADRSFRHSLSRHLLWNDQPRLFDDAVFGPEDLSYHQRIGREFSALKTMVIRHANLFAQEGARAEMRAADNQVAATFGTPDILLNNAGWARRNKPMLDVTEEEFDPGLRPQRQVDLSHRQYHRAADARRDFPACRIRSGYRRPGVWRR